METAQSLSGATQHTRLEQFTHELRAQAAHPPQGEIVVSAFQEASLEAMERYQTYGNLVLRYIQQEKVPLPSYQAKKWFKIHQELVAQEPARLEWGYPSDFANPATWLDYIEEKLARPKTPESRELQKNFVRPLQTNRWERAKAIAYILAEERLHNHYRLEGDPVIHEYGSSANLILQALAHRYMHLSKTEVVDKEGDTFSIASREFDIKTSMVSIRKGMGVDALPPRTAQDYERVKMATLEPSQFDGYDRKADYSYEDAYDTLLLARHDRVSNLRGDIFSLPERTSNRLLRNKADVAFFSHSLAQNSHRVPQALEAVFPYMKHNGIILINDYVELHPDNPQQLVFLDNWYDKPWQCQTVALDLSDMAGGFYPVLQWEDARCRRVRILGSSRRWASGKHFEIS